MWRHPWLRKRASGASMSHGLHMSMIIGEAVLLQAEKNGARYVSDVDIELGKLSCFSKQQLEHYLSMRFEDTLAEGSRINIKEIDPEVYCENCHFEGRLTASKERYQGIQVFQLKCPNCSSENIAIRKGRECKLRQISIIQ